jgi:hypothetical protein
VVAEGDVPFQRGRSAPGKAAQGKAAQEAAGWDAPTGPSPALPAGRSAGPAGGAAAEALAGRRMLRPERGMHQTSAGDAPSAANGSGASAGPADSGAAGLPRRAPQTNLAPQLRGAHPSAPGPGPLAGRDPEQARSIMSAIQQGLRSGRAASTPNETDCGPGGEDPGTGTGWSQ